MNQGCFYDSLAPNSFKECALERPRLQDDLAYSTVDLWRFYVIGISPDCLMNRLGEPMWKQFVYGIICHRYLATINNSITQSLNSNMHQKPLHNPIVCTKIDYPWLLLPLALFALGSW